MIAYLAGKLAEKSPLEVVVDVGGIGYAVSITAQSYEALPDGELPVKLFTYLHLREDIAQLYGFITEEERLVFKLLLSVSGVGPKMAQTILSGMDTMTLRETIVAGNSKALTNISGVGKKTADRIILELRDKITKLDLKTNLTSFVQTDAGQARSDAFSALLSLGYSKPVAEKAMRAAIAESPAAKTDELIRIALKQVQK